MDLGGLASGISLERSLRGDGPNIANTTAKRTEKTAMNNGPVAIVTTQWFKILKSAVWRQVYVVTI